MKRFGLIALAFLPPAVLILFALRPYTHRDLGFLALPFGLPVLILTYLFFPFAVHTNRSIIKMTWPLVLSSSLILSIWMTDWPLHVAFEMAKPDLERLADQFANHENPPMPQRAGIFLIRDGGVCKVDRGGTEPLAIPFLTVIAHPDGPTRFVRAQESYGFSTWSETKLSPEWVLIEEE